jgi:hypothetical protein
MTNDFLPPTYNVPEAPSKYMRLESGENKIRILTSPILGYEWWVTEDGRIREKNEAPSKGDKPVRIRMNGSMPADAAEVQKHFWAMVVWNYKLEQVQILQINQSTIQKPLRNLAKDEDWGSPVGAKGYDISITKEGEKLQTEYSVTAKPKKPLDEGIIKMFEDMNINLEALFENKDPFKSEDVDPDEVKV